MAVSCRRHTAPCRLEDASPGSRACVCVCSSFLAGSGGPASRARFHAPHLSLAALSFCFARPPPGWGCPFLVPMFAFFLLVLLALRASVVSFFLWLPAPDARGLGALFCFPPSPSCGFFVSFAPVVSGVLWFPALGALSLGSVCCSFCWSPASLLFVRPRCFYVFCLAVGCSLVVAAPPPFCVSWFLSLPLGARPPPSVFFCCCFACLLGARRRFSSSAPPPPPPLDYFVSLLLLGSPCALGAFEFSAWPLAAPWWLLPPPPPP